MIALIAVAFGLDYVAWTAELVEVSHPEPDYHFAAELHRELAPLTVCVYDAVPIRVPFTV